MAAMPSDGSVRMAESLRETIDRQILPLAKRFATDVAHVVANAMWHTIAAGVNREIQAVKATPEPPAAARANGRKPPAKKRAAATKVVIGRDSDAVAKTNEAKRIA